MRNVEKLNRCDSFVPLSSELLSKGFRKMKYMMLFLVVFMVGCASPATIVIVAEKSPNSKTPTIRAEVHLTTSIK